MTKLKKRQELYKAVFNGPSGDKVLAELMKLCHFHSTSFNAENPYKTSFNEGQRSVVLHILNILKLDETKLLELIKYQGGYDEHGEF
jgi:hypothetical protein